MKWLVWILLTMGLQSAHSQEEISPKNNPQMSRSHIGFTAGNVSGIGLSYQRDLFRNLSAMLVVGGVAQKSHGDFNAGLTIKQTFSRVHQRVRVYIVGGSSYFYDRDVDGVYDWETGTYTDRKREYVKMGLGLGFEALFFDGKVGVDVNFIGAGASFQKKQDADNYTFGDKPILGPQISLTYNF